MNNQLVHLLYQLRTKTDSYIEAIAGLVHMYYSYVEYRSAQIQIKIAMGRN